MCLGIATLKTQGHKHRYIKKYSLDSILHPFLDDIKKLVCYILFITHWQLGASQPNNLDLCMHVISACCVYRKLDIINGQKHLYYGTMTVFSSGNVASNAVGGFNYLGLRDTICVLA